MSFSHFGAFVTHKKSNSSTLLKPILLPSMSHVSVAKKNDVLALLKLVKGSREDRKIYDSYAENCSKLLQTR